MTTESPDLVRVLPEGGGTAQAPDGQMIQTMIFVTFSGFAMSIVYYVFNLLYD